MAAIHKVTVIGGVLDPDFLGNVGVCLFNLGNQPFYINAGDKLAQIILEKYEHVNVMDSATMSLVPQPNLHRGHQQADQTQPQQQPAQEIIMRGYGGFGSSGGRARNLMYKQ